MEPEVGNVARRHGAAAGVGDSVARCLSDHCAPLLETAEHFWSGSRSYSPPAARSWSLRAAGCATPLWSRAAVCDFERGQLRDAGLLRRSGSGALLRFDLDRGAGIGICGAEHGRTITHWQRIPAFAARATCAAELSREHEEGGQPLGGLGACDGDGAGDGLPPGGLAGGRHGVGGPGAGRGERGGVYRRTAPAERGLGAAEPAVRFDGAPERHWSFL